MEPGARGESKGTLTKEGFDLLLAWLASDRATAGQKYEEIRSKLIKIYARRGCHVAEDLADVAINRVIKKLPEIADTYVGDPALYFYGVATNVFREYLRKGPDPLPLPSPDPGDVKERQYNCLERCMEHLPIEQREFILQYFREQGRAKINLRRQLARRFAVNMETLRVRAFRMKDSLRRCVMDCLSKAEAT